MANINIKKRLENIEDEMEKITKHIAMYSGIPKEHAATIGRIAGRIKDMAHAIDHDSNEVMQGGGEHWKKRRG